MAVDRDGTAGKIDRPATAPDRPPAPPPDRPGVEGAPSRAASRALARFERRPEPRPDPEPEPTPAPASAPAPRGPAEPPRRSPDRPRFPEVTDHSGYSFGEREFAFAAVAPEQAWDMHTGRSPLGFRPEQWDECVAELRAALVSDGLDDAEVRLQGLSVLFCSRNPEKRFPRNESEVRSRVIQRHREMSDDERLRRADVAAAKYRSAGFSHEGPKPLAPFFDSLYRLGIGHGPDAYEFTVAGTNSAGRLHDLEREAPALHGWSMRWEDVTGRALTLSTTDHTDPHDAWTVVGPEGDDA